MRNIQIQLWLAIGIGLAVYISSIGKDLATALVFASTFGLIYGGGFSLLKPIAGPLRVAVPSQDRRKRRARIGAQQRRA